MGRGLGLGRHPAAPRRLDLGHPPGPGGRGVLGDRADRHRRRDRGRGAARRQRPGRPVLHQLRADLRAERGLRRCRLLRAQEPRHRALRGRRDAGRRGHRRHLPGADLPRPRDASESDLARAARPLRDRWRRRRRPRRRSRDPAAQARRVPPTRRIAGPLRFAPGLQGLPLLSSRRSSHLGPRLTRSAGARHRVHRQPLRPLRDPAPDPRVHRQSGASRRLQRRRPALPSGRAAATATSRPARGTTSAASPPRPRSASSRPARPTTSPECSSRTRRD